MNPHRLDVFMQCDGLVDMFDIRVRREALGLPPRPAKMIYVRPKKVFRANLLRHD